MMLKVKFGKYRHSFELTERMRDDHLKYFGKEPEKFKPVEYKGFSVRIPF